MRPGLAFILVLTTSSIAHADDAIAYGAGGLRLGADVIYPRPVTAAGYDAKMDLVWFVSKGSLQVIDLRDAKYKPVVVVKKFPDVDFMISGLSTADSATGPTDVYADIELGKKNKVRPLEGAWAAPDPEQRVEAMKKKIRKLKVVGSKWLKKLAQRAPRTTDLIAASTAMPEVKPPVEMCTGDYEGGDGCGAMQTFGNTGLGLAEVSMSCGDACYTECVLYDPKTKLWADPVSPSSAWGKKAETGDCWGYSFDRDGKNYYIAKTHCTIGDKGITCTEDEAWRYIGVSPPVAP
jgi:hypothetical protein